MKIIVFGSNGMAGHIIVRFLKNQGYEVFTVAKNNSDYNLDIENFEDVDKFLSTIKNCDFIINCVGLLVKDSNQRPDRAAIINGWFPHFLEHKTKNSSIKIIHLSTDCVFNGSSGNYTEVDIPTEVNAYGRSKAFGEINNDKDVTFRMSIIGPEIKQSGTGLFHWVTTNLNQEIPGWDNAWWNGLTTLELAKCLNKYILDPKITGIYHLVNNNYRINKFDLLCKINSIFNLNKIILKQSNLKTIDKTLIDTRQIINFEIPNYDIQLNELKIFMNF